MGKRLKVCFTVSIDTSKAPDCELEKKLKDLTYLHDRSKNFYAATRKYLAEYLNCEELKSPVLMMFKGECQDCYDESAADSTDKGE